MNAGDAIARGDAANRLRDWTTAERAYAEALELDPELAHIWVQYGHALKELGRLSSAEKAYRRAVALRPETGDTHLQLGHLLKIVGRRSAAIIAYEAALAAPETRADALHELSALGVDRYLQQSAEGRAVANELSLISVIAEEIVTLRERLDRIAAQLPAITSLAAWPPALYGRFRKNYVVPPPPTEPQDVPLDIVLFLDGVAGDVIWRQLHGLFDQSHAHFDIHAIGQEPVGRHIIERQAPASGRLHLAPASPDEGATAGLRRVLEASRAEWVILLAQGGVPDQRMVSWAAMASSFLPQADGWICDEELVSGDESDGIRVSPCFRQAVDYDWVLDLGSEGQTFFVRRDVCLSVLARYPSASMEALRTLLLLELSCEGKVGHIPLPLIRRNAVGMRVQDHVSAVRMHAEAQGILGRIRGLDNPVAQLPLQLTWVDAGPGDMLTVVIATRDNVSDLAGMIGSLRRLAAAPSLLRFMIIDNGSETLDAVDGLDVLNQADDTHVLRVDEPFNWSHLNNLAVERIDTPLVVFANDDMTMLTPGWDAHMRGLLARPDVGMVGAKLLYPDDTIQHAGVLLDWNGATIHDGLHEPDAACGPVYRWQVTRAASAVTGAFMGMRCETFRRVGGFDALCLPVGMSDIDLALKVRKAGLKVLWTPRIVLHHFESKSRGLDHLDLERSIRARAELALMRERWKSEMVREPSVNPAWARGSLPFRLALFPSIAKIIDHIQVTVCTS